MIRPQQGSAGRGLARFAIVFDVPPWRTEAQILAALATAALNLTSAVQLQWAPGSSVLAAWKVQGEGTAALESAIPVDSGTGAQTRSSGPTGGRPNQRSYASYAAAATPTPARGARGKGRAGGRRPVPTSLLGLQHS